MFRLRLKTAAGSAKLTGFYFFSKPSLCRVAVLPFRLAFFCAAVWNSSMRTVKPNTTKEIVIGIALTSLLVKVRRVFTPFRERSQDRHRQGSPPPASLLCKPHPPLFSRGISIIYRSAPYVNKKAAPAPGAAIFLPKTYPIIPLRNSTAFAISFPGSSPTSRSMVR